MGTISKGQLPIGRNGLAKRGTSAFLGLDPGEIPCFARKDSESSVFAACGYAIPDSVTEPQPPRPDTPAA